MEMRDSEMKKNDISETFIKKAQALKKLGLSRRVFDKCESQGMFKSYAIDKNNFYKIADLDSFMATASYSKSGGKSALASSRISFTWLTVSIALASLVS